MASNTAGSGLGPCISHEPKPYLLGFPMSTSNRLVFPHSLTSKGVTPRTAVYGPVRTVVFLWAERPTNSYENFDILAAALSGRVVVTLDELRPWWCLIWNAWLDQ
jgi:hypothetical protein